MSKPKNTKIKEEKVIGEPKPLKKKKVSKKIVKKKELMGIDDWFEYVDRLEAKINHIEDTMVDIRNVIVKLTAQSNNIVIFLKELEKDLFPEEMDNRIQEEFNHPFNELNKIESDEMADRVERFLMIKDLCKKNDELLREMLKEHTDEDKFIFNEIGEA